MDVQHSPTTGFTYFLDDEARGYALAYPIRRLMRPAQLEPDEADTAMVWITAAYSTGTYWGFTAAGYVWLRQHFTQESEGQERFGLPSQIPVLAEKGYLRERLSDDGQVVYFVTEKLLQQAMLPKDPHESYD